MKRLAMTIVGVLTFTLAFAIPPGLLAQTALEPGWTVSTFVSGLSSPANGLEFDCATGGFFVDEFGSGTVTFVDSAGTPSFFANVPSVDEMALDRASTFLFAKQHSAGPVHMFDVLGTPLGTIGNLNGPTGTAFDSIGNFYIAQHGALNVLQYPAFTLPPNIPLASVYSTGFGSLEGMRFDCQDNLFITEFSQGNVLQVVPPTGPHVTWVSGQSTPINVAFDPATNDLFVSNLGSGTILRVIAPGVFTTFATGFNSPFALVFDNVGTLYVNEFGGGRIVKLTTPNPATSNCLCPNGGPTEVALDIKPQSCPNPVNVKSQGVLPVAILGTFDFDVTQVDLASVRLEDVAPLRSNVEDVATPFDSSMANGDCLDCTDEGPDGFQDLTLKFNAQEVLAALGEVSDGDCLVLQLTGTLNDGTPIVGEDVVKINKKGK